MTQSSAPDLVDRADETEETRARHGPDPRHPVSTDDFSYNVTGNGVHVRDLHATVLHLSGTDHERLAYRFAGLDFRLAGVVLARVL